MAEAVSFKLATGWVEKLAKVYIKSSKERHKELDAIADELFIVPQELAPVFVQPDLQPYNPADESDDAEDKFRTPAFDYIESFIRSRKTRHGQRVLFILADAGMGKTSLLAMLTLAQVNGFWPKNYTCLPIKLGNDTPDRLKATSGKPKTVLLLDALDEDPSAYGRIKERIIEILKETQGFFRVIITCRNQFLPLGDGRVFPRQDKIKLSGFTCPVKYVSPFNDLQVHGYLMKRFPKTWSERFLLKENKKITYAKEIVNIIEDLRCRPMLLAYVEDLVWEEHNGNLFKIYSAMVNGWLEREERKKNSKIDRDALLKACIYLARQMACEGLRQVGESELEEILKEHPELLQVKLASFGGKSLLNRNSDGDFRFAHQSFQEFLVVLGLGIQMNPNWNRPTDMILAFIKALSQLVKDQISQPWSTLLDFGKYETSGIIDPTEAKGYGIFLKGANLTKANLIKVDLIGADLSRALLKGANLKGSILRKAKLCEADLRMADLSEAELTGADMRGADLRNSYLWEANLWQVDLSHADLSQACLVGANLRTANLRKANLREADLSFAKIFNLENWFEVGVLKGANIYGIQNAPELFHEFALRNSAVELPPDEWKIFKKNRYKLEGEK